MDARRTSSPEFHAWFTRYHATNMKHKMLKGLREKVGLDSPPVEFTNNPNESVNARIKEKVEYKKSELNVFCQKMKEFVDSQTRNIERAFTMDSGPFAVAPEYVHEKENPKKWVKRSKVYKERAINRIHKICMLSASETVSKHPVSCLADVQTSSNTKTVSENVPPLLVSWKDIGLPKEVFSGMWSKASELVAKEANITDAPSLPNSKMVVSLTSPRKPHHVTTFSNGKVTCDCLNYSTKSLCAHVLAIAQKLGVLQSLLDWYKATNNQTYGHWQDLPVSQNILVINHIQPRGRDLG